MQAKDPVVEAQERREAYQRRQAAAAARSCPACKAAEGEHCWQAPGIRLAEGVFHDRRYEQNLK